MIKNFIFIFCITVNLLADTVKDEIYQTINQEFKRDFGVWEVQFNKENLRLRFENINMLYMKGSATISQSFELILKDFFPRYIEILKPYEKYIKKVEINGYTSSENNKGKTKEEKYQRNLILSQERADGVLNFIKRLNDNTVEDNKDFINEKFITIGNSSSKLIYQENGEEDVYKSRRIEFIVILNENVELPKEEKIVKEETKIEEPEQIEPVKIENIEETLEHNTDIPEQNIKTISQYVQRLLNENPTLQEQIELLKATNEDINTAKAAFKPTIDVNYSYKNYTSYDDETAAVKDSDGSRDITVRYNLFNGFKDKNQLEITQANYKSTEYSKEQIEDDLIYSLVEAYITIQKIKDIYKLSRENYTHYMDWVEKEKIRFQNGITALRDFRKVEARSISRFMNFEEDTKRYNDSISKMQKYLDFDDNEMKLFKMENPTSKYFGNVVLALEDIEKYAPAIKEANNNVLLYKQKLEKANVSFLPSINLVGKSSVLDEKYTLNTYDTTTKESSLSVEASINLYAGGADEADYAKKFYEYKQKIAKKDEVIRDARYTLDLSYNKYYMLDSKQNFTGDMVKKREEEYVAANYDYKFAKIDANDLLDVTDSVYEAKRSYIETKYDFILSKYEILKNLGLIKEYMLGEI